MKKILVLSMVATVTAVYGGFWDTVNRVQKTVETVNAVGELINGEKKNATTQPQDAAKAKAEAEAAKRTAPVTTAASNLRTSANQVAAAADPALIASFATARTTATDTAVPEVSYGTVTLKKPATPEQIAEAKTTYLGDKRKLENASIRFEGKTVDDATVAATLAAFHPAGNVSARDCAITTLAPFALLRNLQQLSLEKIDCSDMKPLAGLTRLKSVRLHYSKIGDFTPLATLSSMRELDLYGATLSSPFTPLAACSQLESIDYYATKADPSLYDSLGDLKQVKKFQGGLSKMTSLSWLRRVPNAEDLTIFAEKLEDFDAIGTVTALKRFKGWNMSGDSMSTKLGDLKFLANCKNLEIVELPGSDYSNLEVLTALPKLRELSLNGAVSSLDLAFLRSIPGLALFTISKPKGDVKGFDAVFSLKKLTSLNIQGVPGVTSIAGLKGCAGLKELTVSKGVFPEAEIAELDALIKSNNKYGKVRQY
ncbi:MAG: hypothetical protein IKR48_04265 [Kiritimatiellae bacterium]|nr:hypothetical protein [Kiritimatiellia bacterium]